MTYRPSPLPTQSRIEATEKLIAEQGTDVARWAVMDNLATQWDARANMAAEWIDAGARVLDVGCGAMALQGALKPGCQYFPADVVERRPGAFVVDLNRQQFPPGQYDWITFLGVLEYVHDVHWALEKARDSAPSMIVTYCTAIGQDPLPRRGMGWVNDFDLPGFQALLQQSDWRIVRLREVKRGPGNIQVMFHCARE